MIPTQKASRKMRPSTKKGLKRASKNQNIWGTNGKSDQSIVRHNVTLNWSLGPGTYRGQVLVLVSLVLLAGFNRLNYIFTRCLPRKLEPLMPKLSLAQNYIPGLQIQAYFSLAQAE